MKQQLTLNIKMRDGLRFRSFYLKPSDPVAGRSSKPGVSQSGQNAADAVSDNPAIRVASSISGMVTSRSSTQNTSNRDTVEILKKSLQSVEMQQNILWGERQCGKTHLLQACCAEAADRGLTARYLPLKVLLQHGAQILEGVSSSAFIALDDVDCVIAAGIEARDKSWELALFNLINESREAGCHLLFSTTQNPRRLKCQLPDLASRLIWGGSYRIYPLNDQDKLAALKMRAMQRGFELSDRVLDYLFRRYPRDIESLMSILDRLDEQSLEHKNRITVPFVRQVLGQTDMQ